MYFGTKSYLKSTRNHTTKHALKLKAKHSVVSSLFLSFFLLQNDE